MVGPRELDRLARIRHKAVADLGPAITAVDDLDPRDHVALKIRVESLLRAAANALACLEELEALTGRWEPTYVPGDGREPER